MPRPDNSHADPAQLIRRAQQICAAIVTEECAEFGITPVQYAALETIGAQPGIDATRLSESVAIDRSTLGSVLDKLEAKGLVARDNDPHDRRAKVLHLTPEGNATLRRASPVIRQTRDRILAPLTPGERWQFMRLLEQLVDLNNELSRAPMKARRSFNQSA